MGRIERPLFLECFFLLGGTAAQQQGLLEVTADRRKAECVGQATQSYACLKVKLGRVFVWIYIDKDTDIEIDT